MKTQLLRAVIFGAAVSFVAMPASAGGAGAECLQPLLNFSNGLPESADAMSASQKIDERTSVFRAAMDGAAQAQECYASKIAAASDENVLTELRAGADQAAHIFRLAQKQFEEELDGMSASALSGMAPAAGPETAMGSDDGMMVDSMEKVFDSYMVLENSKQISDQFANLKVK